MRLEVAQALAEEVKGLLAPYCDRIEIAGGVRRGKEEPHDIEIVAVPKYEDATLGFFQPLITDILRPKMEGLLHDGGWDLTRTLSLGDPDKAGKRAPSGPRYYRLKYRGERFDFFVVYPPAQWGSVFLIRTGDKDFSHEFVTRLWKFGLKNVDGHIETDKGQVKQTPEEIDAFELCRLPYIEPKDRTLFTLREIEQTERAAAILEPKSATASPKATAGEGAGK